MHTKTISPPIFQGIRIVNRPDLENVMRVDRACMPMIGAMERNGMRINPPHLVALNARLTEEMGVLAAKVEQQTGYSINIGSGDQLADLLFTKLKLKQNGREKWTKSRARLTADSDVLKAMVSQHVSIRTILDWKEREKLRSTYTLSLIAKARRQRVHTDISLITADTGRLASSDPNLQNIPNKTELGKEVCNAFIPNDGNVIGTVDASQIEMRVNAEDSNCSAMKRIFFDNEDFYWGTAKLMYKRKFTEKEREHGIVESGPAKGRTYKKWFRQNAKIVALMVGYAASAGGLYDQFLAWGVPGWDEASCQVAIDDYFKVYYELLVAMKRHHKRAIRYGFVWDLSGRIRWIPQMKSVHARVVAEGMRQAGNMAGQGGAAFIIKLWMAVLWDSFAYWERHGLMILMQVHDELIVEGPKQVVTDFVNEAAQLLRVLLPKSHFDTPLDGSIGVGDLEVPWGMVSH